MAYAMCPVCGSIFHLNVSDPVAWYGERHPDAKFGDLVPEICPFCYIEIGVGDIVITRRFINDSVTFEPGQKGKVRAIYNSAEGSIYTIDLDLKKELVCPKAAIRKLSHAEQADID